MPQGKGTYGSKVGRPKNKKVYKKAGTPDKQRMLERMFEQQIQLSKASAKYRKAGTPDKQRKLKKIKEAIKGGALASGFKKAAAIKASKKAKTPGYKKAHDYIKKSSATLGPGGYQEEASRVNDARNRSKKSY